MKRWMIAVVMKATKALLWGKEAWIFCRLLFEVALVAFITVTITHLFICLIHSSNFGDDEGTLQIGHREEIWVLMVWVLALRWIRMEASAFKITPLLPKSAKFSTTLFSLFIICSYPVLESFLLALVGTNWSQVWCPLLLVSLHLGAPEKN